MLPHSFTFELDIISCTTAAYFTFFDTLLASQRNRSQTVKFKGKELQTVSRHAFMFPKCW